MRDMVTDQGRPIVMVSSQPQPRYTVEAYLVLERDSEERHEYLDGDIYLMAGESPEHGAICMNLSITLVEHFVNTL
jgi:Uma2 family endonuclease